MNVTLVRQWLRLDLRRRAGQLVVLGLLVAVSSGTVLGALAGARRGASSVDRLTERTRPATVVVRGTAEEGTDAGWAAIRTVDGVAAVSTFNAYTGFQVEEAPAEAVGAYIPVDDAIMSTVERPVVLSGRRLDPRRTDEAVVTGNFLDTYHLRLGQVVTLRLFSLPQMIDGTSSVPNLPSPHPAGPAVPVRIVGVVRSPWFSDPVGSPGRLIPSPQLARAYRPLVYGAPKQAAQWGLVRLDGPDVDLARLRNDINEIPGWERAEVISRRPELDHARDVVAFEAAWMLAFAGVALLTGVGLIGLVVARTTAGTTPDLLTLRAVGATRRQAALLAAAGPAVAGIVGAVAGGALAVAASPLLPIGVARAWEPAPGPHTDPVVLGLGVPVAALAVVGLALTLGRRAAVPREVAAHGPHPSSRRPSSLVAAVRGLPVPVAVGVRQALSPLPGGGATAVRSVLVAAVVGVIGVAGAGTFVAAVHDAAGRPQRFGQPDDLVIHLGYLGQDPIDGAEVARRMRAYPGAVDARDLRYFRTATAAGTILTFGSDPQARTQPTVTTGKPPGQPDEIVLAHETATRLHAHVGSSVLWPGLRTRLPLEVVGIGFVPQTQYNEYDVGAWVTTSTYQELFGTLALNHDVLVRLRPGVDALDAVAYYRTLAADLPEAQFTFVSRTVVPARVAETRDLAVLPIALGVFLAVLALGAVGNALVVSLRRRRRETATLRALGMTPRQSRRTAAVQALVPAVVGLVFGVPLGVAAARVLWAVVAGETPLLYRAPLSVPLLVAVVPGVLLVALLLALPTGWRASRLRVADVLRAE